MFCLRGSFLIVSVILSFWLDKHKIMVRQRTSCHFYRFPYNFFSFHPFIVLKRKKTTYKFKRYISQIKKKYSSIVFLQILGLPHLYFFRNQPTPESVKRPIQLVNRPFQFVKRQVQFEKRQQLDFFEINKPFSSP